MAPIVGVLGGGQLGRMFAEAANRLNIQTIILDKANAPAKQILAHDQHLEGSFKDRQCIEELAKKCDVITIEIEHVDAQVLADIQKTSSKVSIEPSPETIATIQDKFRQKKHLQDRGVAGAQAVGLAGDSVEELSAVGKQLGFPYMLKSRRDAYDGRGNFPVMSEDDVAEASKALGGRGAESLYAEKWAPFTLELAVMVVLTKDGPKSFPVVETIHENSICKLVYAPARGVSNAILARAQELARKAVGCFEGKGVYGVEMFLLPDDTLLINEIAPRPHNSGHYTIEACRMSQYEAHLRAILDLPVPDAALTLREPSVMLNILGGKTGEAHLELSKAALSVPGASIHLYSKGAGSIGRKMGHITVTAHTMSEASALINPLIEVADSISGRSSKARAELISDPSSKGRSPLVAVIMGSHSDLPTLKPGLQLLQDFDIPFTARITSAHRTPTWMADFTSEAAAQGVQVIIGAAGGAAHLPGMAAAHTPLPVIGVPVKGSSCDGMDSLLSIVQMPRGVPVAAVAINNSLNAALLAARILGVADERIRRLVEKYASDAQAEVRERDARMASEGWEKFLKTM